GGAGRGVAVPVGAQWWRPRRGWPVAATCLGLAPQRVKHGSRTKPVPGYDLRVLGDAGAELPRGEVGHLVLRLPLPPGCLRTLWENDAGFERAYLSRFPGYYATSDAGRIDADGYVWVLSRTDDIINVAGHRLSTRALEDVTPP